ncbi:uncharacterized protein LOC116247576 [Nymphaea colorata]|nr:uncharacterized protein LOC116247576 [Nymphaea colorata]
MNSSSSSCVTHCRESVGRPSSARKLECSRPRTGWTRGYVSHPGIRRRAKAILDFLSTASSASSEFHIRGVFGNSPDTSKALRILLRTEKIRRSGVGGRADPFLYTVAGSRGDVVSA